MKSILLAFVVLCACSVVSAQISPLLKTAIGYPYILYDDVSVPPDFRTLTSYPTVSAEMPIPIEIRLKNRMTINPGMAYYFFNEREIAGDITKGKDFSFSHQTLNGYVKVMYQQKLSRGREAFVYAGPIGGFHLITKTKGSKIIYGLSQELPEVVVDVNENGKGFFDMFYYGLVAGFQPHARRYNKVKVSFEVAWLPDFISLVNPIPLEDLTPDISVPLTYTDVGMIQFSVFLGFRKR